MKNIMFVVFMVTLKQSFKIHFIIFHFSLDYVLIIMVKRELPLQIEKTKKKQSIEYVCFVFQITQNVSIYADHLFVSHFVELCFTSVRLL